MKITIQEVMPVMPPKRVILELTEDEAIALAAIMGQQSRNTILDVIRKSYFGSKESLKSKVIRIEEKSVMNVIDLYNNIPRELGYK